MNKDNRGTEVKINDTCCYNWQGQIAFGVVEEIKQGVQYGCPYTYFKVRRLQPKAHHDKEISTVRNAKNLMVV